MAVFPKKDEKVNSVFEALGEDISLEKFSEKFIETYPKDWARIQQNYTDHEKRTKPGKSHPMPTPHKYLENLFKVWVKKNRNFLV